MPEQHAVASILTYIPITNDVETLTVSQVFVRRKWDLQLVILGTTTVVHNVLLFHLVETIRVMMSLCGSMGPSLANN